MIEKAPETRSLVDADVGPYRVVEKLGEGGMGVVYKAIDRTLDRVVALKILFEIDEPQNVKRFQQEAKALAKLAHPNAIQIFWTGEYKGYPCFAMEYISEGVSVYDILREKGTIPLDAAVDIVIQSAKGLAAARRAGIVHRDIKPNNLLIDVDGTVKISDFGLAKIVEGEGSLTQSGIVMGTPYYMSPEQGQGEAIDHRSDLYSLGATFYHMITGFTPYEAQNPVSLIIKHVKEPIPDIRSVKPDVPDAIRRIIETCLEKDPAHRYQEYDDLIEDLEAFVAGQNPVHAPAVTRSRTLQLPPWLWFLSGLAIAGIGGGAIWMFSNRDGVTVEPTPTATLALSTVKPTATAEPSPPPTPAAGEVERATAEMASSDPVLRASAAATFGKLATKDAVPLLVKAAVSDPEPRVRARATWALGRIGDDASRAALVEALKDADATVVGAAIRALRGAGEVRAVDPLKVIAERHGNPAIRREAADALDELVVVEPDAAFGDKPGTWWREQFRLGAGEMDTAKARREAAERTVRYYRQRYGFAAGQTAPPEGSDAEAKYVFHSTYAAAVRDLSESEALVKGAEAKRQALVASADAAQVPPQWRR